VSVSNIDFGVCGRAKDVRSIYLNERILRLINGLDFIIAIKELLDAGARHGVIHLARFSGSSM
jgi:hypothetical protein